MNRNAISNHTAVASAVPTLGAVRRGLRRRSVCVLLTTHNRRDKTLACLDALAASLHGVEVELQAVLVDDGSTDGTATAVEAAYPWVRVIRGDGSLYWCRGMHRAYAIARRKLHDYFVWLNDDTLLVPGALARLMACERALREGSNTPLIVVGSTVDPGTGTLTYGGQRIVSRWRRLALERVAPGARPQRCDAMNGNIVLINAAASVRLGNLDPAYEHAMGDTDYALRARRVGVGVWLAPGVHGHCDTNPSQGTYRDGTLPLAERWRRMQDRKGLPWRSWLHFTRRHAGWLWPAYFAWPYLRLLADAMRPPAGPRRARA